jgi:hypothetical protein
MVSASSVTVLYGESGVGKSSLLNARLEVALSELDLGWVIISFSEWQPDSPAKFAEMVGTKIGISAGLSLAGIGKELVSFSTNTGKPILIVFDQFEEFFLYQTNNFSAFASEVAKIVNRRDGLISIILSLRSDGLFLLDKLRIRMPQSFNNLFRLEPLSSKAAVKTILEPIRAYNKLTGSNVVVPSAESDVVKALIAGSKRGTIVQRLATRANGESTLGRTSDQIILPFLQLALRELWTECIDRGKINSIEITNLRMLAGLRVGASVDDSDGAVGLIAQRYVDAILDRFTDGKRLIGATMLAKMVLPSG